MKRNFISHSENVIGFNSDGLTFQNIVVRDVSPVDEFYTEKTVSSDDGKECTAFVDPIRMLFNQQRLSRIGSTAIQSWLDSLARNKNDTLAQLRSKCSDDELISIIKNRNIQQPSELHAWLEMCNSDMDKFNSELKQLSEQQAFVNEPSADSVVEPSNT